MTSTHASRRLLADMPNTLSSMYFPPASKAEKHDPERAVKGRNEPCAIGGVAWVISRLHAEDNITMGDVVEQTFANTVHMFGIDVY